MEKSGKQEWPWLRDDWDGDCDAESVISAGHHCTLDGCQWDGGKVQPDEEEVIIPGGARFRLREAAERIVQIAGKSARVPYVLFEEIEDER